jgi:hypothetical protein
MATPVQERIVQFQRAGQGLEVELTCGEIQMGSYSLRLWEPDRTTLVNRARGSFLDDEADVYPLPSPARSNDGRILQSRSRIWRIPPHNRYSVIMRIRQGGMELGDAAESESFSATSVLVELRIRLIGV